MTSSRKNSAREHDSLALKREAILHLAERLGNAAEACRRSGVDRTSFYNWKRRYAREGLTGLRDRPPVHKSHPYTTPADVNRRIVSYATVHPAHGCDRIAKELARHGIEVSAVTIQKILHRAGLGTYESRGRSLENVYRSGTKKLTSEQFEFLEGLNPCLKERRAVSARPGQRLCQGTFFLGRFEGCGPVYVHAVLDMYSCYAFGALASATRTDVSRDVFKDQVIPFFAKARVSVGTVIAGRASEAAASVLRDYLIAEHIEHEAGPVDDVNGFLERFRRTTVSEFLRRPFVRRLSKTGHLPRLQNEFDEWLTDYNQSTSHLGYPNYGASPAKMMARR